MKGLSKNEKELMDMDNSVAIGRASMGGGGGQGYEGDK